MDEGVLIMDDDSGLKVNVLIEVENGFSPYGSAFKIHCPPGTFSGTVDGKLKSGLKYR